MDHPAYLGITGSGMCNNCRELERDASLSNVIDALSVQDASPIFEINEADLEYQDASPIFEIDEADLEYLDRVTTYAASLPPLIYLSATVAPEAALGTLLSTEGGIGAMATGLGGAILAVASAALSGYLAGRAFDYMPVTSGHRSISESLSLIGLRIEKAITGNPYVTAGYIRADDPDAFAIAVDTLSSAIDTFGKAAAITGKAFEWMMDGISETFGDG
jgi:hypothetical protein